MPITTLSKQQFQQDMNKAAEASKAGPVFITSQGLPAHVLLTFAEYQKISGYQTNIAELLALPDCGDEELEFPKSPELSKAADFS